MPLTVCGNRSQLSSSLLCFVSPVVCGAHLGAKMEALTLQLWCTMVALCPARCHPPRGSALEHMVSRLGMLLSDIGSTYLHAKTTGIRAALSCIVFLIWRSGPLHQLFHTLMRGKLGRQVWSNSYRQ